MSTPPTITRRVREGGQAFASLASPQINGRRCPADAPASAPPDARMNQGYAPRQAAGVRARPATSLAPQGRDCVGFVRVPPAIRKQSRQARPVWSRHQRRPLSRPRPVLPPALPRNRQRGVRCARGHRHSDFCLTRRREGAKKKRGSSRRGRRARGGVAPQARSLRHSQPCDRIAAAPRGLRLPRPLRALRETKTSSLRAFAAWARRGPSKRRYARQRGSRVRAGKRKGARDKSRRARRYPALASGR